MKHTKKFFAALILLIFAISVCTPVNAFAQTGTLGNESPYLYCNFYDENNNQVDGNALTSGNYKVDVVITGMESAAIMQFTGDIVTSGALSSISVLNTYDETDSSFKLASADFITEEQLVVILVSKNTETCSSIDSEGTVIASLDVEIDSSEAIDFEDYFSFNVDPDLTFFEADYGDGDDCYALSEGEGIAYTVFPMTADVTPKFDNGKIIITGKILIAKNSVGVASDNKYSMKLINIIDPNGNIVATSGDDGSFTAEVEKGTTSLTISGESTVDRTVYLTGTADIENAEIPIIVCDYNNDTAVNAIDLARFKKQLGKTTYNYDLNNDMVVNSIDLSAFLKLANKAVVYEELYLDN